MGALLEERRQPLMPVQQRQATRVNSEPGNCAAPEKSSSSSQKRRIAESAECCVQAAPTEKAFLPFAALGTSPGSTKRRRTHKGPLRAVLLDFDATLTCLDGLEADRLFPGRGGSSTIDVTWIREKGFGGESRIMRLGATLQALSASGVELHIVSCADRAIIVRALAVLGALHFFCDRIIGWQELGSPYTSKAPFIKSLMEEKRWQCHEVLFVDDQDHNLEDVRGICLTHRTWGRGLCLKELDKLQSFACDM